MAADTTRKYAPRSDTEVSNSRSSSFRNFVLRNTQLLEPPLVPEIRLRLGGDVMTLWRRAQEEFGRMDTQPPFWAFAWVGGQAIARYLLDNPEVLAGARILDFGAGSGLCAIAAAKGGAASVLAADTDPFAAEAAQMNAETNAVDVGFTACDLLADEPPEIDLIVAGDVCYEEPMATRVLIWLRRAHALGSQVLIGDPGRAYLPSAGLTALAEYEIPTTRDLEGVEVKRTRVFAFRP